MRGRPCAAHDSPSRVVRIRTPAHEPVPRLVAIAETSPPRTTKLRAARAVRSIGPVVNHQATFDGARGKPRESFVYGLQ
jgi:hypothetical protein